MNEAVVVLLVAVVAVVVVGVVVVALVLVAVVADSLSWQWGKVPTMATAWVFGHP